MDLPSGSVGSQLSPGIAPRMPDRAGVCDTSTLRYHLLTAGHQPGVTNKAVSSGKSISRPPGEDVGVIRPPWPRSIPFGPSVFSAPSTRSWRPLGSGSPVRLGSYVTRYLPTRAATAVLRLTQVASPSCESGPGLNEVAMGDWRV